MKLSEELTWRGFVNQTTLKDISALDGQPLTFYLGVDPSAKSMQVGNLAVVMMVRHFIAAGHKGIVLVGGATGMIGDPDGKSEERELKSLDEIAENKAGIAAQYQQLLGDLTFELVDNYDWFKDFRYLDFLREVGKHVPMRQMLGRDFVQTRLGEDGTGISYAEFSYALIQGYDFLHLFREKGATLQIAGSDQWGNSIAGVELIRRVTGNEAHVWTAPLIVNKATGVKFGKSEGGAVWLDSSMTSVYQFYQFWLNVEDAAVADYLKIYTLLTKEEIVRLLEEFHADPAGRVAQRKLAYEVTKLVHGQDKADAVVKATNVLFGRASFLDMSADEVVILREELPVVPVSDDLYQMIVDAGLAGSKSEARQFHAEGAVSINGEKTLPDQPIEFHPGANLLKRGKNGFAIIDT